MTRSRNHGTPRTFVPRKRTADDPRMMALTLALIVIAVAVWTFWAGAAR